MRSPRLAALELRKFGRGTLPRAALVALLLLPLLYGALYLWSFWDPYGRLDKVPVALVNADRGATVDGKRLTAGDSIVDGLRDSRTFRWRETGAEEARKGLEDGTYYLSLTIPADFSRRIASSAGDSPETGALQVRTNDANNYIVGSISRTVFSEVRAAASRKASRSFYDRIFVSFSTLHGKTQEAAEGADKLGDGIGTARKGAGDLKDGLDKAAEGSGRLRSGVGELYGGAGKLDDASGRLADGAGKVAAGTRKLADRVNGAAASPDARYVKEHAREIGEDARKVAAEARTLRRHLDDLPSAATTAKLARGSAAGAEVLGDSYAELCERAAEPPAFCPKLRKALFAARQSALGARELDTLVQNRNGELDAFPAKLDALRSGAEKLRDKAPTLASEIDAAVRDVNALDSGAHRVADGAGKLHDGAGKLRDGLGTASKGAAGLDDGLGKLRDGADRLQGGMVKLSDGSSKLAGGLHDGAKRIPDYGKDERDARTGVMADPVGLASRATHKAPNYGTGFAPYFIPLSLWVGAMVAYMLFPPLNRRALAAGAPAWRTALAGWLPVVAVGVLQAAALLAVLCWGLGLHLARAAGTIGFLCLVTASFAAIVQWLNARFGPAGRILVLMLLMLQLTSAGGTYPVQTSPGFFNALHPFLPMSYVVDGLRHLITGGDPAAVWRACAVLAAFAAGALALTAWTARRRQVWTVRDLHPELSL
ncbi:YhgE/Pip domain-containing protein [Streptomyces mobaraensis]|uniref:YhgE/Pip domain-containing protein n=1 Tax=Streptomyces mobaraensis TaxID=35621 RepID=A0A5N5W6Y3_STRMB|nr:YhgE/Pip domain-containing protein [Streptomyces mobaraensis]KAB7842802.1 YhgE/Pip domain-containing protein [Streptomyces mobaraensis]